MAKKKQSSDDAGSPEAAKKPVTVKLASVVLCLALAGGGYVMGGRKASASPVTESSAPTTTVPSEDGCEHPPDGEEAHGPGNVVDLPAMSINLAEGHYLRIAVSLGLCHGVEIAAEGGGGGHGESSGITLVQAPALDLVLETLSGESMEELSTEAGRNAAKESLTEHVREAYPAVVAEVFFIEFVMQ